MRAIITFLLLLGSFYVHANYTWTPPVELSDLTHAADLQDIALDPSGNAVAAWRIMRPGQLVIQAATKLLGQP